MIWPKTCLSGREKRQGELLLTADRISPLGEDACISNLVESLRFPQNDVVLQLETRF